VGTTFVFITVGAFVWLFGIGMVAWHVRQRRNAVNYAGLPPAELKFVEQQYRRRMQTSALTITLGALIAMSDYLPQFRSSPGFAAGYVATLLLLAMWLVLLAMGDAFASRVHLRQSLRRNRQTRQALQEAIDEMRRQQALTLKSRPDELTVSASRGRHSEV
jgi:peptidoglycan/LPS O-acetylase OafA/YrhL